MQRRPLLLILLLTALLGLAVAGLASQERGAVYAQGSEGDLTQSPPAQEAGANLLANPWFRCTESGPRGSRRACADGWVADAGWTFSGKGSNPSPDGSFTGAAKLGPSRYHGRGQAGAAAYLWQVVRADAAQRSLHLSLYMIQKRASLVTVTVYGSKAAQGPWTQLWQPLRTVDGSNPWTRFDYQTKVTTGYPYYKVEISTTIPAQNSLGAKFTGVQFWTSP